MGHIKIFEEYILNKEVFEIDDNLTIRKTKKTKYTLKNNTFDQIVFVFPPKKNYRNKTYSTRLSILSGICKILDTNYVSDERVREIPITKKLEKLNFSTKNAIYKMLLEKLNVENLEKRLELSIQNIPDNLLLDVVNNSNNIGEAINKMKIFREYFNKEQEQLYEIWKMEPYIKKYNI